MLEHLIKAILPEIIHLLELIGILIIFSGSMKTFLHFLTSHFQKKRYHFKLELGSALALGLEFKMGAEILKTVLIQDMQEILMLGAIILLRGMLSLLLHFEMKAAAGHEDDGITAHARRYPFTGIRLKGVSRAYATGNANRPQE